jgi:hypothetical protein
MEREQSFPGRPFCRPKAALQFDPRGYETGGQDHKNKEKDYKRIMHGKGPSNASSLADTASIGEGNLSLYDSGGVLPLAGRGVAKYRLRH